MVVEELIAKLGFKVDGLGEIEKFDKALTHAKGNVSRFGTAMNKWLGNLKIGALNGVSAFGGKMAQGFKSAASSIAIAAAGAARMAAGVAAVSVALVGAVALAAKLAYNFVKARGEAARMRREAQLGAEGNRTKIGNVESLQKGLDAIAASGALKDVAKTFVGQIAKEADAAIRGEGKEKFDKAKIDVIDKKTGIQRDTTAVALDVLSKYADMVKSGQDARREAAIAAARGDRKGESAAQGRANKSELDARKFANDFGIDSELMASIRALRGGAEEFRQKMAEANKNNPGLTSEEEDRKKQLAEQFTSLANKFEGISESITRAFGNLADIVALRIIPPLDEFANALQIILKKLGIMSETKGETEDRAKAKAAAAKDAPGVAAAKKAVEPVGKGEFLGWLMGFGDDLSKARIALADAARNYNLAKGTREANAGENIRPDMAASIEKAFQDAAAKLIDAFKHLQDVQRQNSPEGQSNKAGEKVEKKEDRRSYNDIGNDKRQMPVSVTVNATGLDEVAAKVKAAVLGAISTKAANTSTAALNTP